LNLLKFWNFYTHTEGKNIVVVIIIIIIIIITTGFKDLRSNVCELFSVPSCRRIVTILQTNARKQKREIWLRTVVNIGSNSQ